MHIDFTLNVEDEEVSINYDCRYVLKVINLDGELKYTNFSKVDDEKLALAIKVFAGQLLKL
jgi:hypothetical protein